MLSLIWYYNHHSMMYFHSIDYPRVRLYLDRRTYTLSKLVCGRKYISRSSSEFCTWPDHKFYHVMFSFQVHYIHHSYGHIANELMTRCSWIYGNDWRVQDENSIEINAWLITSYLPLDSAWWLCYLVITCS